MKNALLLASALMLSACGASQENTAPKRTSSPIYKKCAKVGELDVDSGQTSRMRRGTAKINACLEKEIIKLSTQKLGGKDSLIIMEKSLKLFATGYQRIYWELSTERVDCRPTCGTINQLTHLSNYQDQLQKILDDLLAIPSK